MSHHQTIHDRLVAGLCALGYEQVRVTTQKYTVLQGHLPSKFAITSPTGHFWSNSQGWVELSEATKFSKKERETLSLPVGGKWTELKPTKVFAFVGKSGALRLNSRPAATTSWQASPRFRQRVETAEAEALAQALGMGATL